MPFESFRKLLIIDDVFIHAAGFKSLLEKELPSLQSEICDDVSNGLSLLKKERYGIIMLNDRCQVNPTIDALQHIRVINSQTKVIVYSVCPEVLNSKLYIQNGALASMSIKVDELDLVNCLKNVMSGKHYLSDDIFQQFMTSIVGNQQINPLFTLTKREAELMKYIVHGKKGKELLALMDAAPSTVSTIRKKLYYKLRIQSTSEMLDVVERFGMSPGLMP